MTPDERQHVHELRWSDIDEAISRLPEPAREFMAKYRTMVERFGRFDPRRYAVDVVAEYVADLQRCMDRQFAVYAESKPIGQVTQGSGV